MAARLFRELDGRFSPDPVYLAMRPGHSRRQGKQFFFEKKNQKLLIVAAVDRVQVGEPGELAFEEQLDFSGGAVALFL